jgi:hypothetical protein
MPSDSCLLWETSRWKSEIITAKNYVTRNHSYVRL